MKLVVYFIPIRDCIGLVDPTQAHCASRGGSGLIWNQHSLIIITLFSPTIMAIQMFFPEVLTALADTMGNQSKNDTIQAFVQHQDISALDYRVPILVCIHILGWRVS